MKLALLILFIVVVSVVSLFLWGVMHELAHYFVATRFVKLQKAKFWFWPHMDENNVFYFARVQWWYADSPLTPRQEALTLFGPRFLDILAVICFPFAYLLDGYGQLAWLLFWGAGLIDGFVGSIGRSAASDLVRYCHIWNVRPHIHRILGIMFVLFSAVLGIWLVLTA